MAYLDHFYNSEIVINVYMYMLKSILYIYYYDKPICKY